ncbi:MAG: carboxypeptidase-like regulatory domain-containing protein [Flavobacteriales bacterium]
MNPQYNPHLQLSGCGCDTSKLYNPIKIMTVQSQIIDFSTGEPIESVNVYLKSKPTIGISTDVNGQFSLEASAGDIIVFSHIGYDKEEIAAAEIMPIENMYPKSDMLAEVVVFGKKNKNWLIALAAVAGLYWIGSKGEDKKTVKATV